MIAHAADGEYWSAKSGSKIDAAIIRCLLTGDTWPGEPAPWPVGAEGVRLFSTTIGGALTCENATLNHPLIALDCQFEKPIILDGATTRDVIFNRSHIPSLSANNAAIHGNLWLGEQVTFDLGVSLLTATIDGSIDLSAATVRAGEDGLALSAAGATVRQAVILTDGRFHGSIDLTVARIDNGLEASGAKIFNKGGTALKANGLVCNYVRIDEGFHAIGFVNFIGATLAVQLRCTGAIFELGDDSSERREVLSLHSADLGTYLQFGDTHGKEVCWLPALFLGTVDLGQAKCRAFNDAPECWPARETVILDGFTFERFDNCRTDWRSRRDWLLHQPAHHIGSPPPEVISLAPRPWWTTAAASVRGAAGAMLRLPRSIAHGLWLAAMWIIGRPAPPPPPNDSYLRPQPWTQTIKVLRDMGYDDDARELAMQREIMRASGASTRWHLKLWLRLLHATIGNGYKPQRALYWSMFFFLLGWLTFAAAANLGFMSPREGSVVVYLASHPGLKLPEHYTRFNAPVYALDNYLPIIELGQDQAWEPTDHRSGHRRDTHDPWYVEGMRLLLGHDWSISGDPRPSAPQAKKPLAAAPPDGVLEGTAGWLVFFFSYGVHRFVYWTLELFGWLFVSLYIAGMSGIVKNE
ncbi:MAG TPA: hypothetical protein VGB91_11840 [Rhizomicrobium sp.]